MNAQSALIPYVGPRRQRHTRYRWRCNAGVTGFSPGLTVWQLDKEAAVPDPFWTLLGPTRGSAPESPTLLTKISNRFVEKWSTLQC